MCLDCFREYTEFPVLTDKVRGVAAYIKANNMADEVDASTLLHSIVADMNVDDAHFDLTNPRIRADYDAAEEWERRMFDILAGLTEPERATAVALEWGYTFENDVHNVR